MVRDIPLYSICEHHLAPFIGSAHVAYIPNDDGRVIGQAGTWNAKKRDGRAYDLPESGDHLVRILHVGRTMTIRVSASPEAPSPTLVSVDLRPPSAKGKKRRLGERP